MPVVAADFLYPAFLAAQFARGALGGQVTDHSQADHALDMLVMAISTRRHESMDGQVHHSDRAAQYTSIRYTKR